MVHPKAAEADIETQMREFLKHAPNKPGGSRCKVQYQAEYFFNSLTLKLINIKNVEKNSW